MPGTLVSSRSFTWMKPRLSVCIPAASRLSQSVLGTLPAAISKCDPLRIRSPVFVCTSQQIRSPLYHGNLTAETAEHLAKFQPDVASTYDQQVFGHYVQFHDRGRIQGGYSFYSSYGWLCWPGASIDEDRTGCKLTHLTVVQA